MNLKLRLHVPLTVGGRPIPHYGEGVPFEELLRSKVSSCMSKGEPFFNLTMAEYNALQEHIVVRLDNSGQLKDAAGNVVPLDLLDAEFNKVLTDLVEKWCGGRWPESPHTPLIHDLYNYMSYRVKAILRQVYGSTEVDIYAPEIAESLYSGRPALFDQVDPLDLRELIENLPARQQQILDLRFGLEGGPSLSLQEAGNELGISKERVRQIEEVALIELQRLIEGGLPKPDELRPAVIEDLAKLDWAQREELLQQLPSQQRLILDLRFGLEGSPAISPPEIGVQLGLSTEQVSSTLQHITNKLRNTMEGSALATVGGREPNPFEALLTSKANQCMADGSPFFELTMKQYDALKEHIILRLDRNGQLEDDAGNVVPLDLLDAEFNDVLSNLIVKWCQGHFSESQGNPYTHELYTYLEKRVNTLLRQVYGSTETDIYAPEIAESLYYEHSNILNAISPAELNALLSSLYPREREIIELRFGLGGYTPLTLEEIAESVGLTKQRVSIIIQDVLLELRRQVPSELVVGDYSTPF